LNEYQYGLGEYSPGHIFWDRKSMRLTALSTGYAIPRTDFNATIHSAFRAAVNLRPAKGDLLITLVVASEDDLPQGIRLATPAGFSFENLSVGRDGFCRDGTLVFDGSDLVVDINQARRWQCNLPALNTDLSSPAVADAWYDVWQSLNEHQVRLGAEIIAQALLRSDGMAQTALSWHAGEAIRALINATCRYQLDNSSALTRLIGLGTGLTPCGDDFLVGYLAGLWCTVRNFKKRRQFVSELGQAAIHLSRQTNTISQTYLYHAAHGQVSRRLDALAEAISRPESPGKLLPVVESAMRSGHTSGMDALTGLLLGLAVWERETSLLLNGLLST
jgi:hypothetical protein